MSNVKYQRLTERKITHWLLAIVTIAYIATGFGITEFKIVESFTFGLLTKNLAFKVHNNLEIPFIILIFLHIYFKFSARTSVKKTTLKKKCLTG